MKYTSNKNNEKNMCVYDTKKQQNKTKSKGEKEKNYK